MEEAKPTMAMHPHKFALWLFIVTIIMLFAAFTSAYIVRQSEGNWLQFDLPALFWTNSAILLLSSATMHWSVRMAKRDELQYLKIAVALTFLLGIAFLVGQFYAWKDLVSSQIFFTGNPAGSFIYVLTGMHGLHIISGLIFLQILLYSVFTFKVHSKSMVRIEMCATYWHFLDILWIYLFAFLLLNH